MSATKIHSAFNDDSIERFNGLKQKKSVFSPKTFTLLLVLILVLTAASAMYSYYYGININCAVHTRACP